MSWRKPSWPEGSRVSTAKPLFGVSRMATGPSALSIIQSPARPRASGPVSDMGGRTIAPRPPPAQALERPETLVSGRNRARACGSVDRVQVVPRPAKPARQTLRPWAAGLRRGHVVSGHALALRKVCRAGFAGRGTPWALCTGGILGVRPRPETESRVGAPALAGGREL